MCTLEQIEGHCRAQLQSAAKDGCAILSSALLQYAANHLRTYELRAITLSSLRDDAQSQAEQNEARALVFAGLRDSALERIRFLEDQIDELGEQLEDVKGAFEEWSETYSKMQMCIHVERVEKMVREQLEDGYYECCAVLRRLFVASPPPPSSSSSFTGRAPLPSSRVLVTAI